jgi:hypothetical protein
MIERGFDREDVIRVTGVSMSRINSLSRRQRIQINRGLVTNMLLDAYDTAESANEMVNAARELGKLHGLYEPEKSVVINGDLNEAAKQLSSMSTAELERLASVTTEMVAVETPDGIVYEVRGE